MTNWQHIDNVLRRREVGDISDNEKFDLLKAREDDEGRYDNLSEALHNEYKLKKAENAQ